MTIPRWGTVGLDPISSNPLLRVTRATLLVGLVLAFTASQATGQERAPTWHQAFPGAVSLPDTLVLGYALCEAASPPDSVILIAIPSVDEPIGVRPATTTEGSFFATYLYMPEKAGTLAVGILGYACHAERQTGLVVTYRSGQVLLFGESFGGHDGIPYVWVPDEIGDNLAPLRIPNVKVAPVN